MKTHSRRIIGEANKVTEFERKAKGVILYDDSAVLPAAKSLLIRVELDGSRRTEWMVRSWRFDTLRLKQRLEAYRAIEESLDAELVVIAILDPTSWAGLPMAWLGLWRDFRRSKSARLIIAPFDQIGERRFAPQGVALHQISEARELPAPVWDGVVPGADALGKCRARRPVMEVAELSEGLAVKQS